MTTSGKLNVEKTPKITLGRLPEVKVYQISSEELRDLEKGSQPVMLTLAIFSLSTGLSFLVALLTTKIEDSRTFLVFVVVTCVGFAAGLILCALSWSSRNLLKLTISQIRDRIRE